MYSQKFIIGVNFGAFPKFRHDYKQGEATMIYGLNKDDEGSNSNGCGKSTILNAEAILLLDVHNKDLSKEDYILDGADKCLLSGEFFNPVLNKRIKIRRKFFRKRSATLEIWENGKLNDQITSVREGNARILELLDLTKDDILNYFMISQGLKSSFFSSTDGEKKKVIARFSKVDSVDEAIENCRNNQNRIKNEKLVKDKEISRLDAKIEANEDSIQYERKGRAKENTKKLKSLKKKISDRSVSFDKSLIDIEKSRKRLKKFKKKNDLDNIPNHDKKKKKTNKKIAEITKAKNNQSEKITELKNIISSSKRSLRDSITCPKCNHTWIEDSEVSPESLKKTISESESKLSKYKKSLENYKEELVELEEKLEEIETEEESFDDLKDDLRDLKKSLENSIKDSDRAKELLENAKEDKKEYEKFKVDKVRIDELHQEIEDYTKSIDELQYEKRQLDEEFSKYSYWATTFTSFKTYLINKVIKTLEGYVNYQLSKFKTYLTVRIDGFTENKDGTINEKMNVLVSKDDGETWQKYARYSGGQKSRINVCSIIAIQKLINLTSKVGGLDFLRLDETFDSLDAIGQIEIVKMFENCGVTTAIISHNNEDIGAANELWIEHKNKISRLMTSEEVKNMKEDKLKSLLLK